MAIRPMFAAQIEPGWKGKFRQKDLPQRVMVTWLDACYWNGPTEPEDGLVERSMGTIQQTVGYVLRSDRKGIAIAQDINVSSKRARGITEIPSAYILEVKVLR